MSSHVASGQLSSIRSSISWRSAYAVAHRATWLILGFTVFELAFGLAQLMPVTTGAGEAGDLEHDAMKAA